MSSAIPAITWLEDPSPYAYLRKTYYDSMSGRGFKTGNGLKRRIGNFYKLLGYRIIAKPEGWGAERVWETYRYEIYWLKDYDRGCPNELPGYATRGMPTEACLVKELSGW